MLVKAALAASLMAATLTFSPLTAEAKTRVHIGIGTGWPMYCDDRYWRDDCDPGWGYYDDGRYYDDRYDRRRRNYDAYVSCGEAKQLLRERGYRRINSRDCRGRTYVFTATKRGNLYRIEMRSSNGAVVSIDRI